MPVVCFQGTMIKFQSLPHEQLRLWKQASWLIRNIFKAKAMLKAGRHFDVNGTLVYSSDLYDKDSKGTALEK